MMALLLTHPLLLTGCGDDSTDDRTPGSAPALTVKTNETGTLSVAAVGGPITLTYEVANPVEGKLATAASKETWMHDFDNATTGKITFTVDENTEDDQTRTGKVVFSYPGAEDVTVTVLQQMPEKPISIAVTEITVSSVKADLTAVSDPQMTFLSGVVKKSDYDAIGSPEKFLGKELEKLNKEAEEYWFDSLAEYMEFLLGDWKPEEQKLSREGLEINTDYYIYAFGIDTKGELTSRLVRQAFKTNDLKTIDFKLSATDLEQKSVTLSADPDDAETNYFLGYITQEEYKTSFHSNDDEVVAGALGNIRLGIGTDASKLDQVTLKGKRSLPFTGLLPNVEYYALAFGIDKSVSACTVLSKMPFTTKPVEIADNCTFAIDFPAYNSVLMNIHVLPSNASTRYYATIKTTDEVKEKSPAQVADEQIAFENGFNMNWAGDKQIFTGERTLHSRRDIGATHILPLTQYTVFVFGVDTEGNRTTEVGTATLTTTAVQPSNMTLAIGSIVPGAETDPDDFFGGKLCNFQFEVTPSTDEEYYYTGIVKKSDFETFASDEAFMADVVRQSGEMIMLNCYLGKQAAPFKGSYTYQGEKLQSGSDYYIFAFGYMGDVTTGLFKEAATADDGEGGGGGWNPFPDDGGGGGWASEL